TAWVAKQFFARPRPAAAVQVVAETGYSFPSMHTTATAALVTIAAYLLARHTPGRAGLIWWPAAAVFAAAVAASRVYLGVHWLTDVAAAVALGAGTAAAVIALDLAAPTVRALAARRSTPR
ncbi:phosphatase PAP2 family protein, partial [Nocardia farcinica]